MLLIVFSISLCFPWVYADSNSLTVLYMAVSGIDDFPDVMNIAIVKGIQLNYHDTKIQRMIPRQKFMEDSFGMETWNVVTDIANSHSTIAKENLHTIMKGMNQTSGIHLFQWISCAEITEDGSVKISMRFGYDGKDYIILEPERMRWIATSHRALVTTEKWNSDASWTKYWKTHLEEVFLEQLLLDLEVGKEYFERKVEPEVFISKSELRHQDKSLTLSCLVSGFYPVEIVVTWLRNGEVMTKTQSSGVRPNHDGTFQIQKEIEISAGDEDQYSCRIEHSSLSEAKLYQWETVEDRSRSFTARIITLSVVAALVIIGIIAVIRWKRLR